MSYVKRLTYLLLSVPRQLSHPMKLTLPLTSIIHCSCTRQAGFHSDTGRLDVCDEIVMTNNDHVFKHVRHSELRLSLILHCLTDAHNDSYYSHPVFSARPMYSGWPGKDCSAPIPPKSSRGTSPVLPGPGTEMSRRCWNWNGSQRIMFRNSPSPPEFLCSRSRAHTSFFLRVRHFRNHRLDDDTLLAKTGCSLNNLVSFFFFLNVLFIQRLWPVCSLSMQERWSADIESSNIPTQA